MIESQRQAEREREEEEKKCDMPDERPRVLDWKDRQPPIFIRDSNDAGGDEFREDDILF